MKDQNPKRLPLAAALLAATLAAPVLAAPFQSTSSGTTFASADADLNGDLTGGGRGSGLAKGTFGPAAIVSQADLLGPTGTFCAFDPDIPQRPIAIELAYFANDSVATFENGDQLISRMASSPPSTVCFNFIDGTSTFEIHRDIVGGTGRFDGATGVLHTTGTARRLTPTATGGFSAFQARTVGEIEPGIGRGR